MDNFTIAVIAGDVIMCAAFIALMVFDKGGKPTAPVAPLKPAGKRPA
ncbi:MAG TPA: hypothetical protein VGK48_00085 [Terriglobia bacterium]|jgi:hypothetical protein